jgi:hypothetical protein
LSFEPPEAASVICATPPPAEQLVGLLTTAPVTDTHSAAVVAEGTVGSANPGKADARAAAKVNAIYVFRVI